MSIATWAKAFVPLLATIILTLVSTLGGVSSDEAAIIAGGFLTSLLTYLVPNKPATSANSSDSR